MCLASPSWAGLGWAEAGSPRGPSRGWTWLCAWLRAGGCPGVYGRDPLTWSCSEQRAVLWPRGKGIPGGGHGQGHGQGPQRPSQTPPLPGWNLPLLRVPADAALPPTFPPGGSRALRPAGTISHHPAPLIRDCFPRLPERPCPSPLPAALHPRPSQSLLSPHSGPALKAHPLLPPASGSGLWPLLLFHWVILEPCVPSLAQGLAPGGPTSPLSQAVSGQMSSQAEPEGSPSFTLSC